MEQIILYDKERRCICTLYMTKACNLNCTYCYHLKKETLAMPIEVAKRGINSTFQRAVNENADYVEIIFHGGEPFIAFERIKQICEWIWEQDWPVRYICNATTNGTLIHGKIKEWLTLNKDRFALVLSLDGTPQMHNSNRPNSFKNIDIEFFKNTWPAQGVKMTPSPSTLSSLAEGIIYIHELGFKIINCNFTTGINWTIDEFGKRVNYQDILQVQLMKLALFYLENPDIEPIEMINMKFIAIAAGKDSFKDKLCEAGTIMRCWTPEGQCLPCHLFYEVYKEGEHVIPKIDFNSRSNISDSKCLECVFEPVCPTCYAGNYLNLGDIAKKDPFTCDITKIRAYASSWMIGQMLKDPTKYSALRNMTKKELAMTTKGIIMVQDIIEKDT